MKQNYATNNVASFGHNSYINKKENCRIGREFIQMIILSSEVEVFSNKKGRYGAETRTEIKASNAEDWKHALLEIKAK